MAHTHRHFVPAAGADWLLPFYDPLTRLLGTRVDARACWSSRRSSRRVSACSTSAAARARSRSPRSARGRASSSSALDPDEKALARARRKAARAGLAIALRAGLRRRAAVRGRELRPRAVLVHVPPPGERAEAARCCARCAACCGPAARLHLLDFGGAGHGLGAFLARLVHREESLRANTEDELTARMRESGFAKAEELEQRSSLVGGLVYYRAQRAAS